MTEPRTEAGRRLLDSWVITGEWPPLPAPSGGWTVPRLVAAIEAEARQGYVPASLSPEWHAELNVAAVEAVTAALARLREAVEGMAGFARINAINRAAVLRAIQKEAER